MLQLKNLTLQRGSKILLEHSSLSINMGEKVGLVGANGAGKTSLFKLILRQLEPDHGEVDLTNNLRIAEIAQEIPHGSQTATDHVLGGDAELATIQAQLELAEMSEDGHRIAQLHNRLAEIDGYSAPSRAAKILIGLGFAQDELTLPVDAFSGGWRMRLNLARVLLAPSDLLLLDEPTNHLDLEAIFWLETWLKDLKQTVIIISHDREFLDNVVSRIVFVIDQQLKSYTGDYSSFEEQYAQELENQHAAFEKQQKKIAHLQSFVDRFRAKASKAKQAQSRMKMIARMDKVAAVHERNPFHFSFKPAPSAGNPILSLDQANIGYGEKIILKNVSLSLRPGDRLGLLGLNGAGKSTLVKVLSGELKPQGKMTVSSKIKIAYFAQHQLEQLTLNESAFWHLRDLDPNVSEKEARQFLGAFNFRDERVFEPIKYFSGGEKARLALALLVWQQPNLLLLDEPSNHLDMEMRQALTSALELYDGALVLITHDRYLLQSLVDEFYLVTDGSVKPFAGDLKNYQQWITERTNNVECLQNSSGKIKSGSAAVSKPSNSKLEKDLTKFEQQLAVTQQRLHEIESNLNNPNLYQTDAAVCLANLQQEYQGVKQQIEVLETRILDLLEQLI
ncbi:MAG: ATP-binding cassette domain-containing protein [Gammaproteobacteria bacterium]|nr:ATP-binding cassette domain-containing protein [Gammaproteobacteria bacterium]